MLRFLTALMMGTCALSAAGAGKGHGLGTNDPSEGGKEVEHINLPLTASQSGISSRELFRRVIQARVWHLGSWTLDAPGQTSVTVGRTLASLKPSFVTGLIRIPDRGIPGHAEIESFESIRSAIRANSPGCRFDMVVDVRSESSGELFVRRLKEIAIRVHPDAWTFYVPPGEDEINPDALAAAIEHVHAKGQLAGYDGPLSLIPLGIDYLVVRAWDLSIDPRQIEALRNTRVPLIVELPTTFGSRTTPGCERYLGEMDGTERAAVLTALAKDQSSLGYRFAFPVFYPINKSRQAFDATKEPSLMVTIRSLMARFN